MTRPRLALKSLKSGHVHIRITSHCSHCPATNKMCARASLFILKVPIILHSERSRKQVRTLLSCPPSIFLDLTKSPPPPCREPHGTLYDRSPCLRLIPRKKGHQLRLGNHCLFQRKQNFHVVSSNRGTSDLLYIYRSIQPLKKNFYNKFYSIICQQQWLVTLHCNSMTS